MTIVNAKQFVRKMRGGAQAHMLVGDDGYSYVVKFRNNPQHLRILVNELVSATLLHYLQIATPEIAIVNIDQSFLTDNPEVHMQSGSRSIDVEPGWHFGSRYPGNPDTTAVYDFMPDALLPKVTNLTDFRAALVFDKWVANMDGRQCIFFRAMVRREGSSVRRPGFVARMIDNGLAFNGWHWDFPESAVQGLYFRKQVYGQPCSLEDFEPWLTRVVNVPEEIMDQAWKRIPSQWIEGDEENLEQLLERLYRRRRCVPELIRASLADAGLLDARRPRISGNAHQTGRPVALP